MQFKTKIAIVVFSTLIAFYAVVGSFMSKSQRVVAQGNNPYGQVRVFDEVLDHIINDYVDQPDLEKVRIGSLRGLADGLDPYSAYLTVEQVKQYDPKAVRGETGLLLSKVSGYAYVVAVLKGSSAEQAGIRDGDVIEYIGNVPSRDLSLYDAEQLLSGTPGTAIELRVLHRGQSRKMKLNRAKLVQPAIEAKIEETGVGYLRVTTLAANKAAEIKTQLSDLLAKGAQRIVLDLRGAANGKIEEGIAVANLFIGSGSLARIVGKGGKDEKTFPAEPSKVVFNGPLAVIIDRSTAGAAEIVAAAVKDQKRGEVVGEKSFGAGSEQQLFSLSDGGALLITTAKYAPAAGKPFMDTDGSVTPTEKVDRPTESQVVLPADDEDEADDQEATPAQPAQLKPEPALEDVQLKKAIEKVKQVPVKAGAAQKKVAALKAPSLGSPKDEVKLAA